MVDRGQRLGVVGGETLHGGGGGGGLQLRVYVCKGCTILGVRLVVQGISVPPSPHVGTHSVLL